MWCRVLLGVIAISYLICVLALSFMQKEDLDLGLLKRVERSNADANQLKIQNQSIKQNEFIFKRTLDKQTLDGSTEGASIDTRTESKTDQLDTEHEKTAKELTYALKKLDLASILECLKHIKVTITAPPSTSTTPTQKSVTTFKTTTAISKHYSFTKKTQNDYNADKSFENMFKYLDTTRNSNKDMAAYTMDTSTENYLANRKAYWSETMTTLKQRIVTSPIVANDNFKALKLTTMTFEDIDSKEINRMTILLKHYKNMKKNLSQQTKIKIDITTIKPITIDSKQYERNIFDEYENRKNIFDKPTTSLKPPPMEKIKTDDFGVEYRLSKILAAAKTNDSEELERINEILAQFKNKQHYHLKSHISMTPSTTEPTTTNESIEVKRLNRLIAEYEIKQAHLKTAATLISPTTIEPSTTERATTNNLKELERFSKLILEYEMCQDQPKTTTITLKTLPTSKEFNGIESIRKLLVQYSNLKKTTTTVKPTTENLTTTQIELLRKLLAKYENKQEFLRTPIITDRESPTPTINDNSKETESLRKLLDEYENQEQLRKATTTTEPIIPKYTINSDYKEIERLKEILDKYDKRQEFLAKVTTTTEPITMKSTIVSNSIERLRKLLATYDRHDLLSTTVITTREPIIESTNDSLQIEVLRQLLDEHKNRQKTITSTITTTEPIKIKTTIIDESKEIERLERLLDDYKSGKITTVTEPITMKSTTIINSKELKRLKKMLAEYETQEYYETQQKITTVDPTKIKLATIIKSKEMERLKKLLGEYEVQENLKRTTEAVTTVDTSKEIYSLSKLFHDYNNRQDDVQKTTISTTTSIRSEEKNLFNEESTIKNSIKLTDSRLHDMLNFWDKFIKTSTPFELTPSTPKITTIKPTTFIISDILKNFNWYKPTFFETTTETTKVKTHPKEDLRVDAKVVRELINGLKNGKKMGQKDEPKPKEKKIINKAVKRIEHYLKIIKIGQDLGSDTQTDYKDTTDTETEDNKTIEVKDTNPLHNDYILKNLPGNVYESTSHIDKELTRKLYESATRHEKHGGTKYSPSDLFTDKTINIKDKTPQITDFIQNYRRGNIYETATHIEKELTEKNQGEFKVLPPEVLKDITKNIKEQVLNDLRKQIIKSSTITKKEESPLFPVTMPPEQHDIIDEKQEATKAIVKFIKIIGQFTTEKETNSSSAPTLIKTFEADKQHGYPAPINILYQHTNLIPPLKVPELAKPYNLHQKHEINAQGERNDEKKNLLKPYNNNSLAIKTNYSAVVLHTFSGEIPPLQVPRVLISKPVVNKIAISTTQPSESNKSYTPEHYDLNFYPNNNRRNELKKIRDSLGEYSNTAKLNVIDEMKNKYNSNPSIDLDVATKHSLNHNILLNDINKKFQETNKEENFKRYTHNVPIEIKNNVLHTDLKFREFTREKYHSTPSPITLDFVNEDIYKPFHMPGNIQRIKGFHERLEGIEQWPKDPNTMIDDLKQEESRASALQMTSRQQLPLSHMKNIYDDSPFRNFIKTQQKVNEILEEILASRAKTRSTEVT